MRFIPINLSLSLSHFLLLYYESEFVLFLVKISGGGKAHGGWRRQGPWRVEEARLMAVGEGARLMEEEAAESFFLGLDFLF